MYVMYVILIYIGKLDQHFVEIHRKTIQLVNNRQQMTSSTPPLHTVACHIAIVVAILQRSDSVSDRNLNLGRRNGSDEKESSGDEGKIIDTSVC